MRDKRPRLLPPLLTLCAALLLLFSTPASAKEDSKSRLAERFDSLDLAINNGNGYGKETNEDGNLAWAESYLLEAYLDMYEATGKIKYLKKFAVQSMSVYDSTDKARKIQDYKGRVRTGWSATKWNKNREPVVYAVHTGMILRPMLRFCLMVKGRRGLAEYKGLAAKYVKLGEDALSEIEGQWRYNANSEEGGYWFEGDEPLRADLGAPMPFNHQLAIGRNVILLYKLTGKKGYLLKARALARQFKDNLSLTDRDAYLWGSRPDIKKYPAIEDMSHGAIDLAFAIEAAREGIVFDKNDLKRFSRTFLGFANDGAFSMNIDGTDGEGNKADYADASGRWLDLSAVDCRIYRAAYDYLTGRVKNGPKEHPQVLLGVAKLVKNHNDCGWK